ncbi:hypothetical protein ACMFMG_007689 [Clarireedia jacksonii]
MAHPSGNATLEHNGDLYGMSDDEQQPQQRDIVEKDISNQQQEPQGQRDGYENVGYGDEYGDGRDKRRLPKAWSSSSIYSSKLSPTSSQGNSQHTRYSVLSSSYPIYA